MNLWMWLLLACLLAYAWKLVGYFVSAKFLQNPRISRVAGTMTIGLLASLVVVLAGAGAAALLRLIGWN